MKHLFKPEFLKNFTIIFIILLVIKLLWFAVELVWLPSNDIDHLEEQRGSTLYYRVKLTPNEAPAPKKEKLKPIIQKSIGNMKDITLLAIYNSLDIVVVTVEYKKKTKVLSTGDEINGFVLEGASNNFATFKKEGKTYTVVLFKGKQTNKNINSIKTVPIKTSSLPTKKVKEKPKGDVIDAGDHKIIDKSLLKHYVNNVDEIYKNIGISEVKKGEDLEGFRISFVRRDSPFSKLGVRRGDMIKSINGQEINSYNAAFNIYKDIQSMNNLTLVIQRGKEEMELEYEIN